MNERDLPTQNQDCWPEHIREFCQVSPGPFPCSVHGPGYEAITCPSHSLHGGQFVNYLQNNHDNIVSVNTNTQSSEFMKSMFSSCLHKDDICCPLQDNQNSAHIPPKHNLTNCSRVNKEFTFRSHATIFQHCEQLQSILCNHSVVWLLIQQSSSLKSQQKFSLIC